MPFLLLSAPRFLLKFLFFEWNDVLWEELFRERFNLVGSEVLKFGVGSEPGFWEIRENCPEYGKTFPVYGNGFGLVHSCRTGHRLDLEFEKIDMKSVSWNFFIPVWVKRVGRKQFFFFCWGVYSLSIEKFSDFIEGWLSNPYSLILD